MQPIVLSLDIGTTAAKAVLFDSAGSELAVAEETYPLLTPVPGFAELDPFTVLQSLLSVISTIMQEQPLGLRVLAAVLSTQGGSVLPVGTDGNPVYPIITWLDQRAAPLVEEWQQQGLHSWIREKSGWEPQPGLPLPVLCTLRTQQPETFKAATRFLSVNDYLTHALTGHYITNPSMAGEMLLTDVRSGRYSPELCALAEINCSQLSPIEPSGTVCGPILPEICHRTGLPDGTPLINGGQDHACEAFALGMNEPGCILLACGTAWVINMVTASPDPAAVPSRMALNHHVIPDRWIASQFLGGLGACVEWWLDQYKPAASFGAAVPSERYAAFDHELENTKPGSSGLLFSPVSGTPRTGQSTGGFLRLRLDHTHADMGRSILESAAFELRHALELAGSSGFAAEQLWMVGGAARSPHWPQILADVCGTPVHLTGYSHGPALGAAIVAFMACGVIDQRPDWIASEQISPDHSPASVYEQAYHDYLELAGRNYP